MTAASRRGIAYLSGTPDVTPDPFIILTYHRVYNYINTTGATSGAGTAYLSEIPEVTPGF